MSSPCDSFVAPSAPRAIGRPAALRRIAAATLPLALLLPVPGSLYGQCGSPGQSPLPNLLWVLVDSVAACPAGDSLIGLTFPPGVGRRPSRLRIGVSYSDNSGCPKFGVPPESIWVSVSTSSGSARVNDAGAKIFADDSTDGAGFARVTIPSLSGCGTLSVKLYVSGTYQGGKAATIRTVDGYPADGRVTESDAFLEGACDINYDGQITDPDIAAVNSHMTDWHRNALFGTLVRRTNLSYAEGQAGAVGESQLFWSPSGRWLSYTVHGPTGTKCHVFLVPSSPSIGDQPKQFTWLPDTSRLLKKGP